MRQAEEDEEDEVGEDDGKRMKVQEVEQIFGFTAGAKLGRPHLSVSQRERGRCKRKKNETDRLTGAGVVIG